MICVANVFPDIAVHFSHLAFHKLLERLLVKISNFIKPHLYIYTEIDYNKIMN